MDQLQVTLKQELFRDSLTHSKYPQSTYTERDHFLRLSQLLQQLSQIDLLTLHSSVRHRLKLHSLGLNPTMEVFRLLDTISTGTRDLERRSTLLHHRPLSIIQRELTWGLLVYKQVPSTRSQFPLSIVLEKDHNLCLQLLISQHKFRPNHFYSPKFPLIRLK